MHRCISRRRTFPAIFASLLWGAGACWAQTPVTAEPTYTLTLPGKQVIHLQVQARTGQRGPQVARIFNVPVSPLAPDKSKKSDLILDANVMTAPNGQPLLARLAFGADPAALLTFEGRRTPDGAFRVSVPEERGTLTFGAPLVTNLTAEMFLGRLYNWNKGGDQTFALFVDYGWKPIQVTTLKLTADGKETIELTDGKFEARKLRYEAKIPHLGDEPQKGIIYIGPLGEVLRCDSAVFGLPFKLRAPAKREEAKRLIANVAFPIDRIKIVLTAERTPDGYDLALNFAEQFTVKGSTGPDYLPTRIESPWRGRPLIATVNGNQLQYVLSELNPEFQTYNSSRPWFAPYWLVTALWEGENAGFGGMKPGEKRDGDLPPKMAGLLQDATFTLERLPNTEAEIGDKAFPIRRYRMKTEKVATDLYTDGSRLIACLTDNGMTIVRDGWEQWTAAQKPPTTPAK